MRCLSIIAIGLLVVQPAIAQTSSGPTQSAPRDTQSPTAPGGMSVAPPATSIPPDGVVRPAPDATADSTVRPPNVDPKMTVPPPGTPGGDSPGNGTTVIPK
jgi:hypothetical protein